VPALLYFALRKGKDVQHQGDLLRVPVVHSHEPRVVRVHTIAAYGFSRQGETARYCLYDHDGPAIFIGEARLARLRERLCEAAGAA
jgi:hypothetical protein